MHFYCIGCDSYFCDLFYIQTGPFHEFSAPFPLCVEKWEWRVSKCSCIHTSAVLSFWWKCLQNLCTMWVFYLPGLFTMELNQQMWFDKKSWHYSLLKLRPFLDPETPSEGIYYLFWICHKIGKNTYHLSIWKTEILIIELRLL